MGVPPKVQPTFADILKTKQWVILHSWVCHLKYSLRLLTLNKTLGYTALMGVPPKVQPTFLLILNKMLGYTALMGVPPKVQPMFADIKQNNGLYCTHGCAT